MSILWAAILTAVFGVLSAMITDANIKRGSFVLFVIMAVVLVILVFFAVADLSVPAVVDVD